MASAYPGCTYPPSSSIFPALKIASSLDSGFSPTKILSFDNKLDFGAEALAAGSAAVVVGTAGVILCSNMSNAGSARKLSMAMISYRSALSLILSAMIFWQTTMSVSAGMLSAAQFAILTLEPTFSALERNLLAANALDPIPASQANIILLIFSFALGALSLRCLASAVAILPASTSIAPGRCLIKGAATRNETAVAMSTPA